MTGPLSAPRRRGALLGVLQNRDFVKLWGAGLLDNGGRWMDTLVLSLLALDLGATPFQVALLFVFRWSPMLAFALLSGMVADRANRWAVMLLARTVAVAVTALLLAVIVADAVALWQLYIASLFLGWLFVLEFPSRRSFIYDMVGGQQIVGAMSLETINSTVGRLAGPLAAGAFVEWAGYTVAFATLLAGYIGAWLLTLLIRARIPASGKMAFWRTVKTGLGYSFRSPVVRGVLAVTIIFNALAFSVESQFPVVARDHLGVGEGLTGVLVASQAIGTLISATVIGFLPNVRYHGRIFCFGVLIQLMSLILFALSPWYGTSFALLLCAGLGAAGFSTMQSSIILISASPEMRGAALGVLGQCIGVAAVGGFIVGLVADEFGARVAVGLSTGLGLALLTPLLFVTPLVRRPIAPPESAGP